MLDIIPSHIINPLSQYGPFVVHKTSLKLLLITCSVEYLEGEMRVDINNLLHDTCIELVYCF